MIPYRERMAGRTSSRRLLVASALVFAIGSVLAGNGAVTADPSSSSDFERVVAGELVEYTDDRLDRSFDVAHDPDRDEYLAVWRDFDGFAARAVVGAIVRADGTLRVGPFTVASQTDPPTELVSDSLFAPRVSFDPVAGRYAVVFVRNGNGAATPADDRRDAVVVGRLVSADGVPLGSEIELNPPLGSASADFCVPRFPDLDADPSTGGFVLVYARTYASGTDVGDVCEGLTPGGSVTVVQRLDSGLARDGRVDFPQQNSGGPAVPRLATHPVTGRTLVTQPFAGATETGPNNRDGLRFAAQVYDAGLATMAPLRLVDVDPVDPPGTGAVDDAMPVADTISGGWFVVSTAPFFGPAWTNEVDTTGAATRPGTRLDHGRPHSVAAAGDGTFVFATASGELVHVRSDGTEIHPAPVFPTSILRNAAIAVGSSAGDGFPAGLAVGLGPDGVAGSPIEVVPPGVLPLTPARLLDTRSGSGVATVDGRFEGGGRVGSGGTVELEVAGRGGVPADAEAVVLNVAATEATGDGFVTSFPCDAASRPVTANLNYAATAATSAGALTPVSDEGTVCLYTFRTAHLVADVNGFVPRGGSVESLVPARLLESRTGPDDGTIDGEFEGIGRIASGSTVPFQVAGRGGVPADAEAVVVNVAAIRPSVETFLTVYPCDEVRPLAANLNAAARTVVNNLVVAKLDADGRLCVFTSAATDLVVDVAAAVPRNGGLQSVVPARLTETRTSSGEDTVDGEEQGIGRVAADSVTVVQVAGRGGAGDDAEGAMFNVAAIRPDTGGFFTVYPCDADERPLAANLNFSTGQIVSNAVFADLSADGTVCVYSTTGTDLTVDLVAHVVDT